MKKNLIKLGIVAGSFFLFAAPTLAVGLCPSNPPFPPGCNGTSADPNVIIPNVINLLLFVAFVAALVFLIIGGIKWIMSGGDKEGSGKAKETVTSALIGLAVVLGAWILINIVLSFFGVTGGISNLTLPSLTGAKTTP